MLQEILRYFLLFKIECLISLCLKQNVYSDLKNGKQNRFKESDCSISLKEKKYYDFKKKTCGKSGFKNFRFVGAPSKSKKRR